MTESSHDDVYQGEPDPKRLKLLSFKRSWWPISGPEPWYHPMWKVEAVDEQGQQRVVRVPWWPPIEGRAILVRHLKYEFALAATKQARPVKANEMIRGINKAVGSWL